MKQGWDLMRYVAKVYAAGSRPPDYQFRMSRATWDELCAQNNLHGRAPIFGDSIFGIPIRIWDDVPDGEVWKVSREMLKDLGEVS